ncbi:sulfatase-modifying factor protein, partial [Marinomonas sp.]|nr:sulfatase-modifying factor protein [Marinomonas sp.]
MNDLYDHKKLKIGQHVGTELEPYTLNYSVDENKATWIADQGGRPFTLRFYQSDKGKEESFLQNARKYANIKHAAITPNYPPFYSNLWVFSCSAVCGGENLYSFLGKYPDGAPLNVVISLFDNIAKALDQAHQNDLYHGHLDLNSIHVVNGIGVMTGFGLHNWMDKIDQNEMDFRFAPPEYLKKLQKRNSTVDSFAFMRLIMAALLGESVLDKDFAIGLPESHPLLSDPVWWRLLKWSRPSAQQRPKSLVEVIRIIRADLYKPQTKATSPLKKAINRYTYHHSSKLIAIGSSVFASAIAAVILWPSSEEEATTLPLPTSVTIEPVEEEAQFESLPQILEEPLASGGTAPKIEKVPPASFLMGDQNRMGDDNEKPVHEV